MKKFKKAIRSSAAFLLVVFLVPYAYSGNFGALNSRDLSSFIEDIQSSKATVLPAAVKSTNSMVNNPVQEEGDSNEFIQFWEDLKSDVFEDVCKQVKLDLNSKYELGDYLGIKGGLKRKLKQYPDKHIALIDEVKINLDGNMVQEALNLSGHPFNVGLNAKFEGKSVVVRKLKGVRYCKEILKVADIRKVKTVIPVNEKRINKMGVGEIWKFPTVFRIGLSGSVGANVYGVSVSFSLGAAKERRPSVTLYKMDERTLRLRIRLDRATIKSVGASLSASPVTIAAGDIGLFNAENAITERIHHELAKSIAREFNKYMAFKLGLSKSKVRGKKILLEFLIDARNPEQVKKLVRVLKGDITNIRKLLEMESQFNGSSEHDNLQSGQNNIGNIAGTVGQDLGTDPNFAGTNHYNAHSSNFHIQLPIIVSHNSGTTIRYDRYQTISGDQVLHAYQAAHNTSNANLNLPFIGKVIKHNENKKIYVVNYEEKGDRVSDPALIYQEYEGEVRHTASSARNMIDEVNDILKYAGVKGEGVNEDYEINTESMFPELEKPQYDELGEPTGNNPTYKSAVLSFSLVFTRKAVQSILKAPAELLMKAFINLLDGVDRDIAAKVSHLLRIDEKGKVRYDRREARKILSREFWWMDDSEDGMGEGPEDILGDICYRATRIISDFEYIKSAASWKERSRRLTEVLAGEKKSPFGYDKMMAFVIQLVNPEDIYAKIKFRTNKKVEGASDVDLKEEVFNPEVGSEYGSQYSEATALRDMFNNPSELTD